MKKKKQSKKRVINWNHYRAFFATALSCLLFMSLLLVMQKQTSSLIALSAAQEATEEAALTPPNVQETLGITFESTKSATLRVPILMYHYIEHVEDPNDHFRELMNTHPELFEEQVKALKDNGYTFMTMKEVGDILDGVGTLPAKPVVLTFDDGYKDFLFDALPIMKKYQAKGTMYMISGFTDNPNHMTKAELEEIMSSGLVEVGAHTIHHQYLAGISEELATTEIAGSKMMLEFMLGVPIVSFAYPFGANDEQAARIVAEAGYTTAVTTAPGIEIRKDNRFIIDRLRPGGRVGTDLINYLEGNYFEAF